MGFVEDEQKSYAEGMKAQSVSIEESRKQKRKLIFLLLPLVIIGGALVIFDYVDRITSDDIFTEDKDVQQQIVEKWTRQGFIMDFNVASRICTFNEDKWRTYTEEDKIGITLMLESYCAKMNNEEKSDLTIRGSITGAILATFGDSGVELR